MVLPVPKSFVLYVATALTVTASPLTTPLNAPAVTAAVVVPSYVLESVSEDGSAIVSCFVAVVGNTAEITPEFAELVAIASATVK